MRKNRTKSVPKGQVFESETPASRAKQRVETILQSTQVCLRALIMRVGLQGLASLLEADREEFCGPLRRSNQERTAYRYGHTQGSLVFGGRKVVIDKPRVRSLDNRELALPTWSLFQSSDPLDEHVVRQVLGGVSSHGYAEALEPVDQVFESRATSQSEVSRRFVAKTKHEVAKFLGRSLADQDFPVVMLDGTHFGDHLLVVALGIDGTGRKQVLGVVDGTTESEVCCQSLLRDLIERGLVVERARLFVIDGGKGLRRAVRTVFGNWALIQRCRIHKLRNVLEHLPQHRRAWFSAAIKKAWSLTNVAVAEKQLRQLAAQMESISPTASSSMLEGLAETLTITEFAIGEALRKTIGSTNPIENLQGQLQRLARNVKRWRGGQMALRWGATGIQLAERRFRRIKGYRDMPALIRAIDAAVRKTMMDNKKKIA